MTRGGERCTACMGGYIGWHGTGGRMLMEGETEEREGGAEQIE